MTVFVKNVKRFIAVVMLLPLASCFVPDEYSAEIRLTKNGGYGISYVGQLTWAPLYGQLTRGEIDREAASEQAAAFLAGLKADGYFESVVSLGSGRYQVRYDRQGQFTETQLLSFVRRNARIFQIRAAEDGTVNFFGTGAGKNQADQLEAIGLRTKGLVRVVTDAEVLSHNAMSVRRAPTPGYTIYDWNMTSFRQSVPKLTLQLTAKSLPTSPGV
ncbi:MAG: hypothetical protein RIB43_15345 [Rhodospirillaceae bacterium]